MSRKKILFLTSWYPSKENETLGNFVEKHADCASEVADIVVLYATSSENVSDLTIEERDHKGFKEVLVYYPKIRSKLPGFSSIKKLNTYKDALWKAYDSIGIDFDLVHLNVAFPAGLFALELKEKLNIPYILLEHWTGYLSHTNDYKKATYPIKRMHKKVFRSAERLLTVSEHLGTSIKDLGLRDDFMVFPNVVDEKAFFIKKSFSESNVLRIIHVSSFNDDHKNISGMLMAISKLERPFELTLITESSIDTVEQFVKEAGIDLDKVKIYSRLDPGKVADHIREADLFVLFSNYETFSVVLAESWMTGTPAIYSKCGGLTEIDDPKIGIQIRKEDIDQLHRELEAFDLSHYDPVEINAFAAQFEKRCLSDEIMKIYDQIC